MALPHDDDEEHGPADELDDDGDDALRVEHVLHDEVGAGEDHEAGERPHGEQATVVVGARELEGQRRDEEPEEDEALAKEADSTPGIYLKAGGNMTHSKHRCRNTKPL